LEKKELLYEGKAKKVFSTTDPDLRVVVFKDTTTAFDGLKKEELEGKGVYNNRISSIIFELLEAKGIPTHFVKSLGEREMLVKALHIIPIEIVARNITAGSLTKRIGLDEGTPLSRTVLEMNLKNDELHDPMLNRYHIYALELAEPNELDRIETVALEINAILREYFKSLKITLVDFKMEFGRHKGEILLGDEISPDSCRFWDAETGEKMDKDRFRRDMGDVMEAYREVQRRMEGVR